MQWPRLLALRPIGAWSTNAAMRSDSVPTMMPRTQRAVRQPLATYAASITRIAASSPAAESADTASGQVVSLFNPRTQDWDAHFRLRLPAARTEGLTPVGRATVRRLGMNRR